MGFKVWIAPVNSGLPRDISTDGAPVTVDEDGVTQWAQVG